MRVSTGAGTGVMRKRVSAGARDMYYCTIQNDSS